MEAFSVTNFLTRSNQSDSPIEQMVKKALSQSQAEDRQVSIAENRSSNSNSDQSNSSVGGGNLQNGNKPYQNTELFRQLSKVPTRYQHQTAEAASGETPRQHPVHDMNHWKALPNPRSNEGYTDTVPNSPSGSSTATFSEDSNHSTNLKPPSAPLYNNNAGPPTVFDFNVNNVKAYSNVMQQDSINDAEIQYVLCESPYESQSQQFQKFPMDPRTNYQEKQNFFPSQNSQEFDWSVMNRQQRPVWNHFPNGNSTEVLSGIINPVLYSSPHAPQQQMSGGMVNNGFQPKQMSNGVIQQMVNGNSSEWKQQHGIPNGFHQQMNNNGLPPQQMNNNGGMQPQQMHNGSQPQQGPWTNNGSTSGSGHPRYINLEQCNNAGPQAPHGNWHGHTPPSPFLGYEDTKNISPTTPPYPHLQPMNQQHHQNQQYKQGPPQMPQNQQPQQQVQQVQKQSPNVKLGSIEPQAQAWSTPQKKPDLKRANQGSQRKTQQPGPSPSKPAPTPKAVIHYRPPLQKRAPPAPLVPVTEIIKNNNARIASIIEEASRTSEVWNMPTEGPRPTRYIIVASPSAIMDQSLLKGSSAGRGTPVRYLNALPMGRGDGGGRGRGGSPLRFKIVTPPATNGISPIVTRLRTPYSYFQSIVSDPDKSLKELMKLQLLLEIQNSRLLCCAKEVETYRTALALTNRNPHKLEMVKLCKESLENVFKKDTIEKQEKESQTSSLTSGASEVKVEAASEKKNGGSKTSSQSLQK